MTQITHLKLIFHKVINVENLKSLTMTICLKNVDGYKIQVTLNKGTSLKLNK